MKGKSVLDTLCSFTHYLLKSGFERIGTFEKLTETTAVGQKRSFVSNSHPLCRGNVLTWQAAITVACMSIQLYSRVQRQPSTQMQSEVFVGIGCCIYCMQPSESLTKEHIIPDCLNGALLFRHAACVSCKAISGDTYEAKALQGELLIPRVLLELKRKDAKRKEVKKLPPIAHGSVSDTLGHDGYDQHYDATQIAQYPKQFPLAMTGLPGLLAGKDLSAGSDGLQVVIVNLQIQTGQEPKLVSIRNKFEIGTVEMVAAKIGYSYAVAMLRSFDKIDIADLRTLVMGGRHDIFNFVGANPNSRDRVSSSLHELSMMKMRGYWVAKVHLFASCLSTPYLVVLGKVR